MASPKQIEASALVPDQLPAYAAAVSGTACEVCEGFLLHTLDDFAALVAYPANIAGAFAPAQREALERAVAAVEKRRGIKTLAVLAPEKPQGAPASAKASRDFYWFLDLPAPPPRQKLRNLLKSAGARLSAGTEDWGADHGALLAAFCRRKAFDDPTLWIYGRLQDYLAAAPEASLYCARDSAGALRACAIADYSALDTAFYMFAFGEERPVPGAADLLLSRIVADAAGRGFSRVNLGLGINPGVEFFKKKWGAAPLLPLVETSWTMERPGFLRRLFGKKDARR